MSQASAGLGDDISSRLNTIAVTADLVVDPGLLSKDGGLSVRTGPGEVENRTDIAIGSRGRHWRRCDGGRSSTAQSRSAVGQCAGQGGRGRQRGWAHRIRDGEDGRVKRIVDDGACLSICTCRKQRRNGQESCRVSHFEGFCLFVGM